MKPPSPAPRSARNLLAIVLLASVFLATLLIAASWSVRSEARDRARNSGEKGSGSDGFTYGYRDDDGERDFSYAVVGAKTNTYSGSWGSGPDLQRLIDEYDRDLLWFEVRGDGYVVVDETMVDRAKEIVAPMNELGSRQGKLGAQQGRLGGKQAAIGAKQARIGARQGALSTLLAALSLEGGDESERDTIEDELRELGRKMEELGRQHEPLAREQEALGRRQEELGRQMERLTARIEVEIRELTEEALAEGKAQPVR